MSRSDGLWLVVLSLAVLGAGSPARADSGYFGWGLECTNCLQEVLDSGLRMEFTSPPELIGIDADGPASQAGLKAGDVILTVDGEPLTRKSGANRLFTARPGTVLRIGYRRGASRKVTTIHVGSEPSAARQGSRLGASESLLSPSSRRETAADAPVRFSGTLGEYTLEVRGDPNVHVVLPVDESWMDIVSGDIRVKIRRVEKK